MKIILPDFIIVPYQLLEDKSITLIDERLYGIVYWFAKLKLEKCVASNSTLAELVKTTPTTIQNSLTKLEEKGYIKRKFKDEARRHRLEIIPLVVFSKLSPTDDTSKLVSPTSDRVSPTDDTVLSPTDDQKKNIYKKKIKEVDISKEIQEVSYGNQDINELIKHYQQTINGSLDGTQQENRRYAHLLINRFKKDYPSRDSSELIRMLVSRGVEDSFHGKNMTSFKYLYYNAMKIIQSVKMGNGKGKKIISAT